MFLRSDFDAALRDAVAARAAAATAYKAGDPRLLAQIDAMATMLSMMSAQLDLAEVEPFIKARDGTVLADASLKGVLPLGRPAMMEITVANPGGSSVTISAGRAIVDGKGRRYVVEGSAVIGAAGSGTITARQASVREVVHTVSGTAPFYAVQIPASEDGLHVAGIEVEDETAAFTYTVEFCNVGPGDRVFHVETDEYRRLWVRFGAEDAGGSVVGHQPADGNVLTIRITECEGKVDIAAGAKFALEYIGSTPESLLTFTLSEVLSAGFNPASIETLRLLARYPALHDSNAVYLSNFDFLLRRHLPPVSFLAVWNERIEEAVRGASVTNINKLFVTYVIPGQSGATSEAQITSIIERADDSYAIEFVDVDEIEVPITVTARVSVVHDAGDVEAQIRAVLLAQYGAGSIAASRGLSNVFRFQLLNQLLVAQVPALQDQISDFSVTIGSTPDPLPEQYRYVTSGSLTVTVTREQSSTGLWQP